MQRRGGATQGSKLPLEVTHILTAAGDRHTLTITLMAHVLNLVSFKIRTCDNVQDTDEPISRPLSQGLIVIEKQNKNESPGLKTLSPNHLIWLPFTPQNPFKHLKPELQEIVSFF